MFHIGNPKLSLYMSWNDWYTVENDENSQKSTIFFPSMHHPSIIPRPHPAFPYILPGAWAKNRRLGCFLVITRNQLVLTRNQIVITRNQLVITRNQLVLTRKQHVITRSQLVLMINQLVITRNQLVLTRSQLVITRNQLVITRSQLVITRTYY